MQRKIMRAIRSLWQGWGLCTSAASACPRLMSLQSICISARQNGDIRPRSICFGLMFHKGHRVVQDYVTAYKWLNLAAARASRRDSDRYSRLRDAVASKMTRVQIAEARACVELGAETACLCFARAHDTVAISVMLVATRAPCVSWCDELRRGLHQLGSSPA